MSSPRRGCSQVLLEEGGRPFTEDGPVVEVVVAVYCPLHQPQLPRLARRLSYFPSQHLGGGSN